MSTQCSMTSRRVCLHLDGDFGVAMGRIQADVSKPGTDDVDLDAGLQYVGNSCQRFSRVR